MRMATRVFVEQAFRDTNTEALMERTGGSCRHPAPSQLILPLAFASPSYQHVVRSCVRGEKCVRVSAKATLAQLPDFGVFFGPLRLLLRGCWQYV